MQIQSAAVLPAELPGKLANGLYYTTGPGLLATAVVPLVAAAIVLGLTVAVRAKHPKVLDAMSS